METAGWDQAALLKEGVVKFFVLADDALGPVELVGALQAGEWQTGGVRMHGGLENGVGVAVDGDEPGVREHLQQELDPAGVSRRLHDERLVIFECELLEKLV